MTDITTTIKKIIARIRGERPATTIARKQNRISRTVSVESAAIATIVGAELASIRAFAAAGLRQIDELVGTGALDSSTAAQVQKTRNYLNNAANAI